MSEEERFREDVVWLAREAIAHYLKTGEYLPVPAHLHPRLYQERRGVFCLSEKRQGAPGMHWHVPPPVCESRRRDRSECGECCDS